MRIATELYTHSYRRELMSVCLRARVRRQIFRNTHVTKADVCDARKEINADQQEKSRNRVIEPSENLYVCITNVIFFSLLSCDAIIISKVDKRTCS